MTTTARLLFIATTCLSPSALLCCGNDGGGTGSTHATDEPDAAANNSGTATRDSSSHDAAATATAPTTTSPLPDPPPGTCTTPSDCPAGELCEPTLRRCVACLSDPDCTESETCVSHQCQPAGGCDSNAECEGVAAGPLCDPTSRLCAECLSDADCSEADLCVEGACQPVVCAPREKVCTTDGLPMTCNLTGTGYDPAPACANGLVCVEDRNWEVVCLEPLPNGGVSLEAAADGSYTCLPDGATALHLLVDARLDRAAMEQIRTFLSSYPSLPHAFAGLSWIRGTSCDAGSHERPVVPIARLPSPLEELDEELLNYTPVAADSALPVAAALEGASRYAKSFAAATGIHTAVVLVSAGGPEACSTQDAASVASAALLGSGEPAVRMFVTSPELEAVAAAGGTEGALSAETLDAALSEAFRRAATCFQ